MDGFNKETVNIYNQSSAIRKEGNEQVVEREVTESSKQRKLWQLDRNMLRNERLDKIAQEIIKTEVVKLIKVA